MFLCCKRFNGKIEYRSNKSHAGVRQKFGQLFVKTGIVEKRLAKHYTDLFEKRHKSDYNDFFDYDKETVLRLLPISKEFIAKIETLISK